LISGKIGLSDLKANAIRVASALLLGAACIFPAAHATNVWHNDPALRVTRVYPAADGSYSLSFNIEAGGCTNTVSPKQYTVQVGANAITDDAALYIYVTAMSAMLNDKQVEFMYNDATSTCNINRMKIIN
jgi:hypothetical protein